MNKPSWRPQGRFPVKAGDVFGDFQVGKSYVVTYRHTDKRNARISVYFGVVGTPDEKGVYLDPKGRYAPTSKISFEILDDAGEDVIHEMELDNEIFPFDYAMFNAAHMDVIRTSQEWQRMVWTENDMFDGEELPNV